VIDLAFICFLHSVQNRFINRSKVLNGGIQLIETFLIFNSVVLGLRLGALKLLLVLDDNILTFLGVAGDEALGVRQLAEQSMDGLHLTVVTFLCKKHLGPFLVQCIPESVALF
jgi:hypothetical protein